MHSQIMADDPDSRIWILVLDSGEEAVSSITHFADAHDIKGASVTALGAFSGARLGWFDFATKQYKPIEVSSQCEGLSLVGDIASGDDGGASLHLHAVVGLADGTTRGGHLLEAHAHPTLEVTLIETTARLRRRRRPELGIALIDLRA
ncbi:PPC domain-containing DNA-binding protein [Solimonas marina]|uniref:DNA-binding protein n=1 Tax=Solimonas marina TaxID=2714601 RepID=A0A969WE79_9GAMM|nr:PPC domain-containing DNA-binding protein [Solimonas marina]NKF24393.1 DNA-binding protein [Solimonas marina]